MIRTQVFVFECMVLLSSCDVEFRKDMYLGIIVILYKLCIGYTDRTCRAMFHNMQPHHVMTQ